jgi:ATP-dependent DNA helicase RecQ
MTDEQKSQIFNLLKIHFGYDKLRPGQERAIDCVLNKKSTLVIMPTGGGKSLCYQLPALVLEGVTIVISPLIALMKDQVDSLDKVGIPATFINSSISLPESYDRLQKVKNGFYKLLYIAPERFYNQEFMSALQEIKVSLFAIDEAHCISHWGHDFRPSYMKLKNAIANIGNPPVIALTATATPEVKEDIIKQLDMKNPEIVITGFARPNLQFGAAKAADSQKFEIIKSAILSSPDDPGIVYVGTRNKADSLLQYLLENDIQAVSYHAGMEAEDRKWVQDNFMSGKAKVVIATNAFGLGINKTNIKFVIHHDMPGTVEAYYQEAGRAGRDGRPSFCLLLYHPSDRYLREFFIQGDNPSPENILEIYNALLSYDSDKILITYAEIRKMLPSDVPEMAIGTAVKILEREGYVARANEKSANAYLKLLSTFATVQNALGTRAKNSIRLFEKLYNRFKDELETGWEINLEEVANIIGEKKDSLARLVRRLADGNLIEYKPPFKGTEINILQRVAPEEVKLDFTALKEKAKHAYQKLDQIEDYVYHPGCRQEYILRYFGDGNAQVCGKCDNCLTGNGYNRKHEAPDRSTSHSNPKYTSPRLRHPSPSQERGKNKEDEDFIVSDKFLDNDLISTKLTQLETFELYKKGMKVDDIAQTRNLKPGTIVEHFCWLIKKGMEIKIDDFVEPKKQKKIIAAARELGMDKIAPIKDSLGDEINYDEIRLTLAKAMPPPTF